MQAEGRNMPAYASFFVGHMELNEEQKARDFLNKMQSHFNGPFQVMSEMPYMGGNYQNMQNNFNFLPGYAAFIQSFMAGFGGLRVKDFQIDLIYPTDNFQDYQSPGQQFVAGSQSNLFRRPTPTTDAWNITGLSYRGTKLDIIYNLKSRSIEIKNRRPQNDPSMQGDDSLEVIIYEGNEPVVRPLRSGDIVKINLASESWTYNTKSKREMRSEAYPSNIQIMASIYSVQYAENLVRQSDSSGMKSNTIMISFLLIFLFKLVKFISN